MKRKNNIFKSVYEVFEILSYKNSIPFYKAYYNRKPGGNPFSRATNMPKEISTSMESDIFYDRHGENPYSFMRDENYVMVTNDAEVLKKHYADPLKSINIVRITTAVEKTEKGYTFSYYYYNKRRGVGKKYFAKKYHRHHINVNMNTGNFYVIESYKLGRRKQNIIRCNNFNRLEHLLENVIFSFTPQNTNVTHIEMIKHFNGMKENAIRAFYNNIGINLQSNQIPTKYNFFEWFVKYNNIKVPNNYTELLTENYPGKRQLKKNDYNLITSILDKEGINSKFYRKLLNKYPNFPINFYKLMINILGEKRAKSFNYNRLVKSEDREYGYVRYNFDYKLNDTQQKNLLRILNDEDFYDKYPFVNVLRIVNIVRDQLYIIKQLEEYGVFKKENFNYSSMEQLNDAHTTLSNELRLWEQSAIYHYDYNEDMVKTFNFKEGEYECVLFDKTEDYYEEGNYQGHCVATYDGSTRSFILSIRKGKERVTVEIDYEGRVNQAYGKHNTIPSEEMNEYVNKVELMAKKLYSQKKLEKPELILRGRNPDTTLEIDQVENIFHDPLPF